LVEGTERERLLEESKGFKVVRLGAREISDLELIAIGGLSPLEGFQGKSDYESILRNKRLANGLPWTIPITLSASRDEAVNFHEGDRLSLVDLAGEVLGIMDLEEKFPQEREKEAKSVYGTNDQAHPGVAALYSTGYILLAGKVWSLNRPAHQDFSNIV
jgi:sulfate adenylyltransferase